MPQFYSTNIVPQSIVNIIATNTAFFSGAWEYLWEFEPYGEAKLFKGTHLFTTTTKYQYVMNKR